VNKYSMLSRVGTAGLALALGTLPGCHDDNNPNAPAIVPVPNSIVVANINGAPDLLVATTADEGFSQNPGYAGVILNTPGALGTFQTGVHYYAESGTNPSSIAVADLTGSGHLDLVMANFGTGSISVFMHGATPGTFNAAVDMQTGGQPNQVVSCDPHAAPPAVRCDLTGNGKPSLVLADMSASGNVIVLKGDPANPGKFLAPVSLPTGLVTPSVAVADLTGGNARPAIVAAVYDANGNNGAVLVFSPANTASGFGAPMSFRAGAQPQSVKIADVNGDGLPDIIVANFGPGNDGMGSAGVSVLLQDATHPGSFLAPVTYSTPGQSIDVFVADLNDDNKPDLVVANLLSDNLGSGTGSVSVLLQGPQSGVFLAATNYDALPQSQPLAVWVADLNGDGHPDIALADGPGAGILLQDAASPGTFLQVQQVGY